MLPITELLNKNKCIIYCKNITFPLFKTVVDVEFHPNPNAFTQPPSLSHMTAMPHIHLTMATKPPQLLLLLVTVLYCLS